MLELGFGAGRGLALAAALLQVDLRSGPDSRQFNTLALGVRRAPVR